MILFLFCFICYYSVGFTIQRRRYQSSLGVISLLVCLVILFYFGSDIWNLIRDDVGNGYLGFISSSPDFERIFREALSPVIYGIGLASIIHTLIRSGRFEEQVNIKVPKSNEVMLYDKALIFIPIIIYILGQGTSLINREVYLQTNGIRFIARLGGVTNLVSLGVIFFIINRAQVVKWRFTLLPMLTWFVLLISAGTRVAIVPLFLFVYWIFRNVHNWYGKFSLMMISIVLIKYSYELILLSRGYPGGLMRLPENFNHVIFHYQEYFGHRSNFFYSILGGIFTVVITVPMSVGTSNLESVLQNANPLISNISSKAFDTTSNGVERIFPYNWVPTSTAGVLYGAVGALLIFTIFFIMTMVHLSTLRDRTNSLRRGVFLVGRITFYCQFLFYLEYSSRIWFRIFWAFWLSVLIGKLLSERHKERSF